MGAPPGCNSMMPRRHASPCPCRMVGPAVWLCTSAWELTCCGGAWSDPVHRRTAHRSLLSAGNRATRGLEGSVPTLEHWRCATASPPMAHTRSMGSRGGAGPMRLCPQHLDMLGKRDLMSPHVPLGTGAYGPDPTAAWRTRISKAKPAAARVRRPGMRTWPCTCGPDARKKPGSSRAQKMAEGEGPCSRLAEKGYSAEG